MLNDSNPFKPLFEPLKIGPVVTRNRFFQAPHGSGLGHLEPSAMAEMRRIKAEGGWGIVATEQVEIHPSSDRSPLVRLRNWDDRDIPTLAAMASAVHLHGSLAALVLSHNGLSSSNLRSREVALAPSAGPAMQSALLIPEPFQAKPMSHRDIMDLRSWHRQAVRRAMIAGFDIICIHAGSRTSLINQFLSPVCNRRVDDYGGPIENRLRLLQTLIEDTRDEVGDQHAVAVRVELDPLLGHGEDLERFFELLGELPDLWDIVISERGAQAGSSRFDFDQRQIEILRRLRDLTSKPIVTVRFFSTPGNMLRMIRDGLVDLIGCARQSIADPFLPRKLQLNEPEQIRVCIKCNVCVAYDQLGANVRCTQNPTFGEEWHRGWHPEILPKRGSDSRVLVVGAGPAGLECACALGQRGYSVDLFDAAKEPGGRVRKESVVPGLQPWQGLIRTRTDVINSLHCVKFHPETTVGCDLVFGGGYGHVVIATGARWRSDGLDRRGISPSIRTNAVYSPDDLLAGARPSGRVLIYDDDHYYLGGALARWLAKQGNEVVLLTPAPLASIWTHHTLEQPFVQRELIESGVQILTNRFLDSCEYRLAVTQCVFTGKQEVVSTDAVVLVTAREAVDRLGLDLEMREADWRDAGIVSVARIGDALVPGMLAQAIYSGHKYARGLDCDPTDMPPVVQRDVTLPMSYRRGRRNSNSWSTFVGG